MSIPARSPARHRDRDRLNLVDAVPVGHALEPELAAKDVGEQAPRVCIFSPFQLLRDHDRAGLGFDRGDVAEHVNLPLSFIADGVAAIDALFAPPSPMKCFAVART
jgi:hypothetical protein